jgi:hypothetical protein
MMRFILVFFPVLSLLFFNTIFEGDIKVQLEAPTQINAGNEIKVNITLNKGKLNGFSRFQMELPKGLTAVNIQSANADFSFQDQKVRFIWLRMPDEETLTISFTILCNENLKGNFDLVGKFSYIEDNERKTIDIQPQTVAIVPNPNIDPNLLVDIKDFGKFNIPNASSNGGQIACIRETPAVNSNKEYIVNILVNKESLKKFAKIEEIVPKGFTAVNVDSKEGIFTFRDGKVKYLWMNMPASPYFVVSYKLISSNGETLPLLNGSFSYMDDDKTKSIPIIQKDASLASLTPESVKSVLAAPATSMAVASNGSKTVTNLQNDNNVAANNNTTGNLTENKQVNSNTSGGKTTDTGNKQIAQNTNKNQVGNNQNIPGPDNKTVTSTEDKADILEPETGITFRVQIAAGHKPINVKRYFRKYKLDNSVNKEQHEGWLKYSIGSFKVYRDARDYRTHIWNTTPITDAFVAAYNEGKRITVQEGLMVTNQKWYK